VQTTLIAEIATGYYNLLMLDDQLNIAQKNVALTDTLVNMMRLQKTAGQVTELAVQQTEVQQQTAALLIPQLEQQIAIQENTIKILSGELPSSINRTGNIESAYVWDDLSVGFPAELLSKRPDVRANEMALVAANAPPHRKLTVRVLHVITARRHLCGLCPIFFMPSQCEKTCVPRPMNS
jgi:outer membrane protein TolC